MRLDRSGKIINDEFNYNKRTKLEWSVGMMKPTQKKCGLLAILFATAILFSSCGAAAEAEPTTDPNMVFTQVAETVMVSMTQTFEAMPPTATPEPTATVVPTQPIAPTVDLSQATQAVVATAALAPTITSQVYGDAAKWNTQSPVDGTVLSTDEDFTFHVCMDNVGTTDWTDDYYLNYIGGYNACFDAKVYVGETVSPDDTDPTWCFDLSCRAPSTAGTYTTYWYLRNDDGENVLNGEVYFTYKTE